MVAANELEQRKRSRTRENHELIASFFLMCQASIVSDDWVTKGCHIHVDGVELMVYPDHCGGVGFRPFFSSTPKGQGEQATKAAYEKCLPDPEVRNRWIERLDAARLLMLGYSGALYSLANGRMAEFKFLRIAVERWGEQHGNA
jgi:hypothetical protein